LTGGFGLWHYTFKSVFRKGDFHKEARGIFLTAAARIVFVCLNALRERSFGVSGKSRRQTSLGGASLPRKEMILNRNLFLAGLFLLLCPCLPAVPGLISYQGMLRDDGGHSITTATDLTFTFWDQESGGNQLGDAFSDTDTVTPDSNGLFTTLIGDDGSLPVPESIFAGDSVWLNLNAGGVDLSPRTRITSVGFAVKASSALTAKSATSLSPALNQPGDRFNLGNNTWFEVGSDGQTYLYMNGRRQGHLQGSNPSDLTDNISPDGQNAASPQVAMDDNGNAIIVWRQSDGSNNQIFKSEYRSGAWTHPLGLTDNISPDGGALATQVAMDNNGNAIIVWHQADGANYQIFKSEYRAGAWTHPTGLADNISPDGQNATDPQVVMGDNGNAIIVWGQSDGLNGQVFKSEYRSGAWTHPSGLTDNISPDGQNAGSSQVAMDNNGNAIIVWCQYDGENGQIFKSEYRSGAWAHPSDLADHISPDGQNAMDPQVAMDNNGNAIIVWGQSDSLNGQVFKSEYRSGAWTLPSGLTDNISPDGANAYFPQEAMDDNGNAIIVWSQSDGSKGQIFKSEYRSGVWTHPAGLTDNISPDGQQANSAQVAMGESGNAIIVWCQSDGSNDQVFKSEYGARAWTHPSSLSDNISPDGRHASSPQVATGNNGNAIIVWSQSDGSKTQIFKSEFMGWGF